MSQRRPGSSFLDWCSKTDDGAAPAIICSVLLGVSLNGAVAAPRQSQPERSAGVVAHLTDADHSQAIACGRSGEECAIVPYQLCPSETGGRYSAQIATPYSRVAKAAFEAAKSGRGGRGMERGAANRWGTGIYVFPAERSVNADAIQRIEIRREGRVIEPTTSTVAPIALTMPDGSTKQLARGFFSFPPDVFSPNADVTVVFVGVSGTTSCTLQPLLLRRLR
jgi:hypothetical protein